MKKAVSSATATERKHLPSARRLRQRPAVPSEPMLWRDHAALRGKKKRPVQLGSVASNVSFATLRPSPRMEQCRHFWVIDLVGGPTSLGVCKRCDEQRQFSNYLRSSGVLPEKDMSKLSHGPGLAVEGLDTVLRKDTGGGAVATAARRPAKTWTYPRRGDQWIRQQRSQ